MKHLGVAFALVVLAPLTTTAQDRDDDRRGTWRLPSIVGSTQDDEQSREREKDRLEAEREREKDRLEAARERDGRAAQKVIHSPLRK